jgi:uncharacterized membrane protein
MRIRFSSFFWWLITSLTSGTILAGIFLAPIFKTRWPALSAFIYSLYAPLCHQQSGRSFFLAGQQLAACSRCSGIYAGFFCCTLFYPLYGKKLKSWLEQRPLLMVFSALPMVLDFSFNILGLANSPLFIKSLTGFVWSSLLPFYWFKALKELEPTHPQKKLDLQK